MKQGWSSISFVYESRLSTPLCRPAPIWGGKKTPMGRNPAQRSGWTLLCFNIWWHLVTSQLQILASTYPLHHAVLGCFNPLPLLSSQIWLLMLWLWPRLNGVVQQDVWMYAALMEAILSLIRNLSWCPRGVTTTMMTKRFVHHTKSKPSSIGASSAQAPVALWCISPHCVHCQQINIPMANIYVFSVYTLHKETNAQEPSFSLDIITKTF